MNRSTSFKTPIGICTLSWNDRGITRLRLPGPHRKKPDSTNPPPWVRKIIRRIFQYMNGRPTDLASLPLDMSSIPPFHRKVYKVARTVAPGRTATYQEIATGTGSPHAARAVGQALARNPFAIVVPCHRIVASNGRLGGFSANGGIRTKARLLEMEGHKGLRAEKSFISTTFPVRESVTRVERSPASRRAMSSAIK